MNANIPKRGFSLTFPLTPSIVIGLAYALPAVFMTHPDLGIAGKLGLGLLHAGLFMVVNTIILLFMLIKLVEGKLSAHGIVIGFLALLTWGVWGPAPISAKIPFMLSAVCFDYFYLKRKLALVAEEETAETQT